MSLTFRCFHRLTPPTLVPGKRLQQRFATLTIGGLCAAGLTVGLAAPALAADYGVSIADYCARNVSSGNPFAASKAVNINNSWNGWRCATVAGLVGVDVAKACTQQGGGKAVTVNSSASGWRCRR